MAFIDDIMARAKADKKTIVLPESMDKRTFEAAEKILKADMANLIIIGTPDEIAKNSEGFDITGATIVDPFNDPNKQKYIDKFVELRGVDTMVAAAKKKAEKKGLSEEETAALIEPIKLSSLAKDIPVNYIGIAGTVTNGNRQVTLYSTTSSYTFSSLSTKNARTGDCVFCRGVLTPLTGASDSVKALRVYNGYAWQAPKTQDYSKYRDLALLDLAACARVYKKANVAIPTDIDTVFDIIVTNQFLTEKLTAYEGFIDNLFSKNICLKPNLKTQYLGDPLDGFKTDGYKELQRTYIGSGKTGYYQDFIGLRNGFSLYDYASDVNNERIAWATMCLNSLTAHEMKSNEIEARFIDAVLTAKDPSRDNAEYVKENMHIAASFIGYETTSGLGASKNRKWQIGQNEEVSVNNQKLDALLMKFPQLILATMNLKQPSVSFLVNNRLETQGIIEHNFDTSFGYIKWANGLLIQWGSVTASISKTDYKDFPTSFSSKNSWFAATQSNKSEMSVALGKMLKGTSGANFLPWARAGSNNYSDTFEYIAIGYQLNGLLIQWGKTTSSSGKASVSFRAYTSRESYAIFVAEGVQDCETRTTQDDTNGYDFGAGIDQKYESSCIFTCQSNRNIFYLAIGYQLNGLLIQWGVITSSGTFAFPSAYKNRPFFVGIGRSEADGGVDYDEIAHAISETEYRLKYHYSDVDWLAIGISS